MTQILHRYMFFRLRRGRIVPAKTSGTIRVSDMSNEEGFLISLLTVEEGHFSPVLLRQLLQHSDLENFTGKFVRGAPLAESSNASGLDLVTENFSFPVCSLGEDGQAKPATCAASRLTQRIFAYASRSGRPRRWRANSPGR